MPIRGILFDKDGTLLDFHRTWGAVYKATALIAARGDGQLARRLLFENGYDADQERLQPNSLMASGTNLQVARAWQQLLPDQDVEGLAELIDRLGQVGGAYTATAVPRLAETIADFKKRGFKLGVATNDSEASTLATLGQFGILDQFDFICGYDSGFGGKPGPGMVHGFFEKTGCGPADTCVVGDNAHDMDMGKAAAVALRVGVLTGTSDQAELTPLADTVLPSVAELAQYINQWNVEAVR